LKTTGVFGFISEGRSRSENFRNTLLLAAGIENLGILSQSPGKSCH